MTDMNPLPRIVRALAAACLVAAGGAAVAADAVTDALLAPLKSAYTQAVTPGDQADLHRELFGTVLRRVHRSYPREVDVPALVAAALKAIEPVAPQSADPAEVFRKSIN